MIAPVIKPTVKLTGHEGNAFSIMGRVKQALRCKGADREYIENYLKKATSGITIIYCLSVWNMLMLNNGRGIGTYKILLEIFLRFFCQ